MIDLNKLKVKIFLDTANLQAIKTSLQKYPFIKGFTTNPSLMHKEGVKNYEQYCKEALRISSNLPISFEVFSDDIKKMEDEARIINSWGGNSYVKIPITNTKKESSKELIKRLAEKKVKLNITAIMTLDQVKTVVSVLNDNVPSIISVFAGRIADTGKDPIPLMKECLTEMKINPKSENKQIQNLKIWRKKRNFKKKILCLDQDFSDPLFRPPFTTQNGRF